MKTILVPLIGDPKENLYQLGLKERESYLRLEARINSLLSANNFLRYGQDIISRARALLKKKEDSFFEQCIEAYAEGLGIEPSVYMSFLSMFELAAHYGQVYPELKGLLPGCTTLFEKTPEGFVHNRLIDFPLIGSFNENPRLYYWKIEGKPAILNYSCEGLAPLFFQTIHDSGFSMSLHHKPGLSYHKEGQSIFKIAFEGLFEAPNMNDFRRELRKKISVTKWGFYMLELSGNVVCTDIDGPAINFEAFNLNESSPLIFTNIPLHKDPSGFEHFIGFCQSREVWLREKLGRRKNQHTLDLMTDVKDQKTRKWIHPVSTLSTVGAIQINLAKGIVQVKEGDSALTSSDPIVEFSLANQSDRKLLKKAEPPSEFERAWKHASLAQSHYDQGQWDQAYHHLQMAEAIMPHTIWKEILKFYLNVWNFKFVTNKRELALIYRDLKKIVPPEPLKDQWLFLCMRMEKRLGLVLTVNGSLLSPYLLNEFKAEIEAPLPLFNTWMKLLYPRLEILDVFSPHHR
jgi:hypothetical protein